MATRQRVEVLLTDADEDIIDYIKSNEKIPRSALFKNAMRYYMNKKEEEQFDARVKRLLSEVIAEKSNGSSLQPVEVKPKKELGFGSIKA